MKTALLPAMRLFPGQKKATLEQCAEVWAPCTVQIMTKDNGKVRFVVGSGFGGYDPILDAQHDQTGANLGTFTQIGEVRLNEDGIIAFQQGMFYESAPVLVYK